MAKSHASALDVFQKPIPKLRVPYYDSSGTYPQVLRSGMYLRRVNAALREAILADQRAYTPGALAEVRGNHRYHGVYKTYPLYPPEPQLISASTVVVSTLIPTLELYPEGNDGEGWISTTVLVPSGKTVTISDLFTEPRLGIAALARAWKEQIRVHRPRIWRYWLPPRAAAQNFQNYALTRAGLTVGDVGGGACGRFFATVSYSVLRSYLSPLGRKLIASAREPRSS